MISSQRSHRQQGATLIVALVLLVVLTVFALAMMRLSTNSLQVVGNMQAQRETESRAQTSIERQLDTVQPFTAAVRIVTNAEAPATIVCDSSGTTWTSVTEGGVSKVVCQPPAVNSYTTKVYLPECVYVEPSVGYPLDEVAGYSPPEDTYWDVKGVATDSLSGASAEVHQGVRIQRTKGNCP